MVQEYGGHLTMAVLCLLEIAGCKIEQLDLLFTHVKGYNIFN